MFGPHLRIPILALYCLSQFLCFAYFHSTRFSLFSLSLSPPLTTTTTTTTWAMLYMPLISSQKTAFHSLLYLSQVLVKPSISLYYNGPYPLTYTHTHIVYLSTLIFSMKKFGFLNGVHFYKKSLHAGSRRVCRRDEEKMRLKNSSLYFIRTHYCSCPYIRTIRPLFKVSFNNTPTHAHKT